LPDHTDAYTLLAEKHGYGESEPYLRVLKFLMTPKQADIVTRLPGTPDEVAKEVGLGPAIVNQELAVLFKKGVVILEDPGKNCYRFSKYADRMWEVTESLLDMKLYTEEERKRLVQLWDDWKETDYADRNAERWLELKAAGIQALRIVPAYRSILDSPEILPHEDPREIVRVQPLITVVSCSCRKHMGVMGKACRKSEADVNCLQFAKSAEYSLSRGHGRRISQDEAIAILERNEEDGLVHQWINHAKIEAAHPYALCSCCRCCCVIWHAADIRRVPNDAIYAKSRYEARVDAELCEGCKDCVERCQFDAIKTRRVKGTKRVNAVVNPDKCWGCGVCALACRTGALRMHLVRPPEHIPLGD
jgi:Na+-translocating ferredoxin:NAD+ oxidoreductase RNF subunit RnfB